MDRREILVSAVGMKAGPCQSDKHVHEEHMKAQQDQGREHEKDVLRVVGKNLRIKNKKNCKFGSLKCKKKGV